MDHLVQPGPKDHLVILEPEETTANGTHGSQGPKGEQGDPGADGIPGLKGPKGEPGFSESWEKKFCPEFPAYMEFPVKMVLKENQEHQAEMVSTDYPASQDSKGNLVHLT